MPTRTKLADLGTAIERFGLEANESAIAAVANLAAQLHPAWVLPAVLADLSTPPAVRVRALAKISTNWDRVQLEGITERPAPGNLHDHSLAA